MTKPQKINKVTPRGDVTWYVKWIASILMLAAVSIRSAGVAECIWLDLTLSLAAASGWLFVGIKWNDRALIMLNSVFVLILASGLIKAVFG